MSTRAGTKVTLIKTTEGSASVERAIDGDLSLEIRWSPHFDAAPEAGQWFWQVERLAPPIAELHGYVRTRVAALVALGAARRELAHTKKSR